LNTLFIVIGRLHRSGVHPDDGAGSPACRRRNSSAQRQATSSGDEKGEGHRSSMTQTRPITAGRVT
jgi:hypothetical protein